MSPRRPKIQLCWIVTLSLILFLGASGSAGARAPAWVRKQQNNRLIRRAANLYDARRRGPGDYASVNERQAIRIFNKAARRGAPTIAYDPRQPEQGIESYLKHGAAATDGAVTISRLHGGKSGAKLFKVRAGTSTSVLKIFPSVEKMLRETAAIQTIRQQRLGHLGTVRLLGVALARDARGREVGATCQSLAAGRSVDDQLLRVARATGKARAAALTRLSEMAGHVAVGLAELHNAGLSRRGLTRGEKMANDVVWLQQTWRAILDDPRFPARLKPTLNARMRRVIDGYLQERIRGTITHGDARGANFFVDDRNRVTAIDVETLMRSVYKGAGVGSFAGDVGRFMETVAIIGAENRLSAGEVRRVQGAFMTAYRGAASRALASPAGFEAATRFFRVNMACVALKADLRGAASVAGIPSFQRLLALLR